MISNTQFLSEWKGLKNSLALLQGYFSEQANSTIPLGPEWELKKDEFNACLVKINELIPILVSEKPDPTLIGQDVKDSLDLVTTLVKMIENK
ncbi:MAG: hypothetical protein K2Q22_14725, partial [Cytophagales bacterium]|nr:hypothetical protein [Cytophagales bacterium]